MRVSSRIISGSGILIVLALLSLTYQVFNIHRDAVDQRLALRDRFPGCFNPLRLDSAAEAIFQFSKNVSLRAAIHYASSLDQVVKEFDAEVVDLQETIRPPAYFPDISRLVQAWSDYKAALEVQRQTCLRNHRANCRRTSRKIDSLASRTALLTTPSINRYITRSLMRPR